MSGTRSNPPRLQSEQWSEYRRLPSLLRTAKYSLRRVVSVWCCVHIAVCSRARLAEKQKRSHVRLYGLAAPFILAWAIFSMGLAFRFRAGCVAGVNLASDACQLQRTPEVHTVRDREQHTRSGLCWQPQSAKEGRCPIGRCCTCVAAVPRVPRTTKPCPFHKLIPLHCHSATTNALLFRSLRDPLLSRPLSSALGITVAWSTQRLHH